MINPEKQLREVLVGTLASHRVWGLLDSETREKLASVFICAPFSLNSVLFAQGALHDRAGLILSGKVLLQDPDAGLSVILRASDVFGFGTTPMDQLAHWEALGAEDGVVAWLSVDKLLELCSAHPQLGYFFPLLSPPSSLELQPSDGGSVRNFQGMLGARVGTLLKRDPVILPLEVSIQAVAEQMRDKAVSCIVLTEQDRVAGIVTDRDLRNRVVAAGLDTSGAVSGIATLSPLTVRSESTVFEAMLMMTRHNIHHLPVLDGVRIVGVVTVTDLSELQSPSAIHLAARINKENSLEGLIGASSKLKPLQQHLDAANVSAYSTGHIITSMTDAFTRRLIQLTEDRIGPAPVDYVWVAAGSQARNEQSAKTDQDNCLILDNRYDEPTHGEYFRTLTKSVCDGLAACGYIHCPGEMMAMTDKWRQPQRRWARYFRDWIDQPDPNALMLTCVFFDVRAIHGRAELLGELQKEVLERTRGNSLFLAHMIGNALKHRPPLGMFGNFSLSRHGDHERTIDLKHGGIVPIVDLARVYALAGGISVVNTHDRLGLAHASGEVSSQSAHDLRDAFEFLAKLRISHQAAQTQAGIPPDNYLALEELSGFERTHLKSAFQVVQRLQELLSQRYRQGL